MPNTRLVARLDVKGQNLIKGVHLEGLRVIGDPNIYARRYYDMGIDEILYMDIVASLYGRNNLTDVVKRTARNVFIPITVGGGIRSIDDARDILRAGADKVAINTAATKRPELISELARRFGKQCVVLSIEAKRLRSGTGWEVYTDNGREQTGLDVLEWVQRGVDLGAGEVLVTSVDQEGTRLGFEIELLREITKLVDVPVVASGGMGTLDHAAAVLTECRVSAVAMADILHYDRTTVSEVREHVRAAGIDVRIP